MVKRIIVVLLFQAIACLPVSAQLFKYGVHVNIGIEDYVDNTVDFSTLSLDEKTIPYGSVGFSSRLFLFEGYFAELGLNVNYSNRQFTFTNNYPLGFGEEYIQLERKRSHFYLALSPAIGVKMGKVLAKFGLQPTFPLIVDDSRSERISKIINTPEPIRSSAIEVDYPGFFLEQLYQISFAASENLEFQVSMVHNPRSDGYDSLFPKFRFALGVVRFWRGQGED